MIMDFAEFTLLRETLVTIIAMMKLCQHFKHRFLTSKHVRVATNIRSLSLNTQLENMFLRFFLKIQKTRLFTFIEGAFPKKTLKNVIQKFKVSES